MNTQDIVGGLLTAKLQLSIGCPQSKKLKEASVKACLDAGAVNSDGSATNAIGVSAKLWSGSEKVTGLQKKFVCINRGFDALTLPWSKGVRIFRSDRAQQVHSTVQNMIDETNGLIDEIVDNYATEVELAVMALGREGRIDNYPDTGEEFRGGVMRRLCVDTLAASNKIVELVGGQLGLKLAREHEEQLRNSIGEAQRDAADRLHDVLRRFADVCDPSKDRTRVTDSLFEDLKSITTNVGQLLLFPNPKLEEFALDVKNRMSRFTREDISKHKHMKDAAHREASSMINTLMTIPIV